VRSRFKQEGHESGLHRYASAVIACMLPAYLLMRHSKKHPHIGRAEVKAASGDHRDIKRSEPLSWSRDAQRTII
jgi:hypothetical protein